MIVKNLYAQAFIKKANKSKIDLKAIVAGC